MTDMTIGTPWRHLIKYALPLLAANALQLLYNAADTVIAGRFIGPEALALFRHYGVETVDVLQ